MGRGQAPPQTGACGAGDTHCNTIGGAGDQLVWFDHQIAAPKTGRRVHGEWLECPIGIPNMNLVPRSFQPGLTTQHVSEWIIEFSMEYDCAVEAAGRLGP